MTDYMPSTLWPALHPPYLTRLPCPPPHPNPSTLPPSQRYRGPTSYDTLQDEADELEIQEVNWHDSLHATRNFGYSWLIPLGRSRTAEQDRESEYEGSPREISHVVEDESAAASDQEGSAAGEEMAAGVDLDAEVADADAASEADSEDDEEEEEGEGSNESDLSENSENSDGDENDQPEGDPATEPSPDSGEAEVTMSDGTASDMMQDDSVASVR